MKPSGLNLRNRHTRKQVLLIEMNQGMLWADRLALTAPHAPVAKARRPPFELALMLRRHCMSQWFGLSDLGAEEALFDASCSLQEAQSTLAFQQEGHIRLCLAFKVSFGHDP